MEQHEARTPQHSPPRSARPPAGQDARLPRPAEAAAPDPDDDFLTAMRASGFASVPASAPAVVHAAARGPAQAGPARAPARAPAPAAPGRAPAPPRGMESSTVYRARPQRPALPAAAPALRRRMPAAKLTGLGCWLLATVALLAFAFLDRLLFGGAPAAYGVCYLLVGVAAALWVRPYDLVIAPVTLPIAFTLGALPLQHGADGFDGLLMGVFTVLALNAGWLYRRHADLRPARDRPPGAGHRPTSGQPTGESTAERTARSAGAAMRRGRPTGGGRGRGTVHGRWLASPSGVRSHRGPHNPRVVLKLKPARSPR